MEICTFDESHLMSPSHRVARAVGIVSIAGLAAALFCADILQTLDNGGKWDWDLFFFHTGSTYRSVVEFGLDRNQGPENVPIDLVIGHREIAPRGSQESGSLHIPRPGVIQRRPATSTLGSVHSTNVFFTRFERCM